ncbi:MAG: sigma-70 family RNA polymerase sigma factor [Deltaproteobacteria bacterium]|nr:MAG: sigma-70 family RNA polymerase sigma factor [Deltaproteobacteria bacterium]
MGEHTISDPESWVDEHGDILFRYALFRIQDVQLAEDLVQETFLAALRARDSFAGRSSVRTWLFGILKHKIIDHIRKASRERPADDIEKIADLRTDSFDETGGWKSFPAKWTTDPGLFFQQREFWATLKSCLSELPPRLNQAFTLRELDGLSADEVRKILNVSPTNGGVMLHRARMRLRDCLESKWFGKENGNTE